MIRRILKSILVLVLTTLLTAGRVLSQDNGTEFGVMDDLTVLGVQGDYLDPDVEIKGFTVFGATQTAYTANISSGPGNVIINGVLGVSSGAYIAGASTFAYVSSITISGANAIFINGGNTDNLLAKDEAGYLKWIDKTALGDNLGNHIATMTLTANYGINASTITVSTLTINNTLYGSTGTFTGYLNANAYLVNNSTMVRILPGTDSIAYGVYAGTSNLTTGNYNVFIGNYAGTSNTDGDYNVAVGPYALFSNTTGSSNTANGAYAGYNITTGSANTLYGFEAGYNITTGTGNIIIGYKQNAPSATSNNTLNIGGLIFGTDMVAGGTGGKVGISTNAPQATLDIKSTTGMAQIWRDSNGVIVGSMSATGVLQAIKFIGDGSGLTNLPPAPGDNLGNHIATMTLNMSNFPIINVSSINITGQNVSGSDALLTIAGSTMVVLNNGNVGIGTIAPEAKLQVVGGEFWLFNEGANPRVIIGDNGNTGQYGYLGWDSNNDYYRIETDGTNGLKIKGNYVSIGNIYPSQPLIIGVNTTELFRIQDNGNVGIGTTAPCL